MPSASSSAGTRRVRKRSATELTRREPSKGPWPAPSPRSTGSGDGPGGLDDDVEQRAGRDPEEDREGRGRDEPAPHEPAVAQRRLLALGLAHEHVDDHAEVVESRRGRVEDRGDSEDAERRIAGLA